ncbi:SDR family NAD(P)-dependent oxidoreductase [Oceanicoccus sagamiensis]|uniref:SDR family NAD(P)-dependent oxidoreductase n=1 Tax=Oceanicoccus sagamiensis TaxID=716816 RepID=UPI000A270E87|nr:SDR family oxidoreductase [Oceanicoccus sagamiensis]
MGRASAALLAEAGAHVIAVARTASDLDSLQAEYPQHIQCWVEDVSSDGFMQRLSTLEQLDILVNNVGTNKPQPFTEVDSQTLDNILALNVRTAFLVAQAAASIMVKQGAGSIIHLSSQMGHIGAANRTVYCMSKHAIEGLNKAMAVELAPHNVRVNAVAPTYIETPLTQPMLAEAAFKAEVLGNIPLNRIGKVQDVAAAVLYLASGASNMVTGESLKVDGGWTAV